MEDLGLVIPAPAADSILEETVRLGFGMPSEPLVDALLRVLAASKPGGRFLELGTGSGVGTAWLLSGMSADATLITVDTDGKAQAVARQFLGHDRRLQFVNTDGLEYLATQSPTSFDLVFADAMPGKYEGLSLSLALVKVGGFWVGDDLLPQPNWPEGHAAKIPVLLDTLSANAEFCILPIAWASGLVVAVRRAVLICRSVHFDV